MNSNQHHPSTELRVKRIRPEAVMPFYAHPGDSGMDLVAAESLVLAPGEVGMVPTGLILSIPRGFEVQIRARSGLSLRTRLRLPNSPGTIDSGYRDELHILVENASQASLVEDPEAIYEVSERLCRHGTYRIEAGDRIAQMVFARVTEATLIDESEALEFESEDRGGGFGSSGTRVEGGNEAP